MRVKFSPDARVELRSAARYFEERRPTLGLAFHRQVRAAVLLIATNPEIGAVVPDVNGERRPRRLLVSRFPYWVVYLPGDEHVVVLAVAHCRQAPEHWAGR